nr:opine metallophore biosynthesis dehydrogenase [Paenibacillus protaetiae]
MYKLFPEGPIMPESIRHMVLLWKEISGLLRSLGAEPVNLLKFLNDDNYPVREESLTREELERFPEMEQIKQEYLLYVRYASILIDPYSEPDENGRYYDFSAFPYERAACDLQGRWTVPRVPYEDYCRIKLLTELARLTGDPMETANKLAALFENQLSRFVEEKGAANVHERYAAAPAVAEDAASIWAELQALRTLLNG